jgi:ADP-heptose:LPS heptosyltransferase
MKTFLKHIVLFLRLGSFFRKSRESFFCIFDILGGTIFKLFGLTELKEFNEKTVKNILIIRMDRIGDVILSTPAIRAVRETFPNAQIHLLVMPYTKDLVINNPNINKLLVYKKDVLDKDYDLAFVLCPGILPNYMAFKSGAKVRIGYSVKGGSFFLTSKLNDDRAARVKHTVESALEVVGIIECKTSNKKLEISITPQGENFANNFFKQNNLMHNDLVIVVHPGARQKHIRWKKERFAKIADILINEKTAKIILIGSENERSLIEEVTALMSGKAILALGLRLTELISLIKRVNLFIGNSTGPMHIAAALQIPTVAIFGNIHPLDSYQKWGPWGNGHMIVSKNLQCNNCHPSDCYDFMCLESITVDDVLGVVKKQLKNLL